VFEFWHRHFIEDHPVAPARHASIETQRVTCGEPS
jgi:hypothetical protein